MKFTAVLLLILGALINYLSKFIFKAVRKAEPTDKQNLSVKLIGVAVFLVGLILTVVYFR